MANKTNAIKFYILVFLAFVAAVIWAIYFQEPDNNLHIFALDVGQGDAILIEKGNYQILVDGGPDDKVISELSKIMPLEDRTIEKVILTHPHSDHLSGLLEIIERYQINEIKLTGVVHTSDMYLNFLKLIKEKQIPTYSPKIGDREKVFENGEIIYLWPSESQKENISNLNNTSIVFRLNYGKISALFPGDSEIDGWKEIIKKNKNQISNVNYFKIPHHGSENGLNEEIISIIKPEISIISLGKNNKYGFPHKQTLNLLEKIGSDIYRTDIHSTINISTDGEKWWKN